MGRDVLKEFVAWYRSLGVSGRTIETAIDRLEDFVTWLGRNGKDLECFDHRDVAEYLEWLRAPRVLDPRIIRDFIEEVPDLYWKTLFAVLYETGARVSEVITLRIGDLAVDEYGFKVTIRRSKSEERIVRVTEYAPLLRTYMGEVHSFPDAHLLTKS